MPTIIRRLLIVLASLIALFVIAGVVITKVINPNDYKGEIISAVNKAAGRQLNIDGDIRLSLFPWLGVDVTQVKLSNPQGFPDQSFLEVGEAEIKLRLLPLFIGKVEFGAIVLNNANLNLIKKATGTNNWADLQSSTASKSNGSDNEVKTDDASSPANINVTSISIQDSHIKYVDEMAKNTIDLNNLNLDSSSIGLAKSFPVSLSFNMRSKNPKLNMGFNGNTEAYIDLKNKVYKLDSLKVNGQVSTATAKNLSFAVNGDFLVDLNKQAWNLNDVSANLAQMSLKIDSKGDLSNSTGEGKVIIKSFNAQTLLQQLEPGIKFSNNDALTNVSAQFSFNATPSHVSVPDFVANIDKSNIKANFDYESSSKRSLNYLVTVDQINVDKYQMTMPASKSIKKAKASSASQSNPVAMLAFLTNLNGSGKIEIGQLTYNHIPLNNLLIQSTAANNVININPIRASIYKGSLAAKANLNLQSNTPLVTADANLTNFDLNKALSDGKDQSRIYGLLNLQTHLTTTGKNPNYWINNLQGNGNLEVTQGVIKGIDLNFWLLQGISVLKKLTPNLKGNTNQTPFNGMKASFTIYQGVLSNQDLVISTQELSAKGRGNINLPQQTIKYHILAQNNDKSLLANNLQIPIIITGPLDDPKVQLDMAVLTASLLKQGLTAPITTPINAAKAIPQGAVDILSKIKF